MYGAVSMVGDSKTSRVTQINVPRKEGKTLNLDSSEQDDVSRNRRNLPSPTYYMCTFFFCLSPYHFGNVIVNVPKLFSGVVFCNLWEYA